MRPLEERFPTLYHDIVHESPAAGPKGETGPPKEVRKAKATAPTLYDAIAAVCSVHRVTDIGLMKDLTASINEFLGLKAKAAVASEEDEEDAPKRKRG